MKKSKGITLSELAKYINIHKATLSAWLCHYSLSKYVYTDILSNNVICSKFVVTKQYICALKKYLANKNKKYLKFFNENYNIQQY